MIFGGQEMNISTFSHVTIIMVELWDKGLQLEKES
jgi:hypothetical protein